MNIMKNKKRTFIKIVLVFLCLLLTLAAFNYKTIMRIYHGITLFEDSRLSENFRNLDQRFPAVKVACGEEIFYLKQDLRDLPDEYTFLGERRSVSDFIEKTGTTGLLVAKGHSILYEEYFNGYTHTDRMITWSVSKSVISALVGIAVEEGYIFSVYDLVTDYVPSLSASGYNDVSIKEVLQMSSGIGFNEDYSDRNSDVNQMGSRSLGFGRSLEDLLITLEREREPGTYNQYVSSDTQVLGMVLREATGVDIAQYTQEKLWKPAGMEFDAYWLTDSTGVESAFGGFNASLRDLARFGILYLNYGFLMDRQIIPQKWIEDSIRADAAHLIPGDNSNSDWVLGYGYQWWIPDAEENDYLAIGIYGQAIYINLDRHIVIVKTSAYKDYNVDGEEMELESIEFFRHLALKMGL
ncbi:UNVERIFIED_CONTAM: CubicO group peptidase (beta-lactamase class C family) [Acetivibrio alkalicellulosi]